eukprot:1818102-Pyramimonas_sp.AAC.1
MAARPAMGKLLAWATAMASSLTFVEFLLPADALRDLLPAEAGGVGESELEVAVGLQEVERAEQQAVFGSVRELAQASLVRLGYVGDVEDAGSVPEQLVRARVQRALELDVLQLQIVELVRDGLGEAFGVVGVHVVVGDVFGVVVELQITGKVTVLGRSAVENLFLGDQLRLYEI